MSCCQGGLLIKKYVKKPLTSTQELKQECTKIIKKHIIENIKLAESEILETYSFKTAFCLSERPSYFLLNFSNFLDLFLFFFHLKLIIFYFLCYFCLFCSLILPFLNL